MLKPQAPARRSSAGAGAAGLSLYQVVMLALCVFVLIALAADAAFRLSDETRKILQYADTAVCVVFLSDFIYRLITAESKLGYLKWGWIDLVSSIPTLSMFRWGRSLHVLRTLQLLRGVRATRMIASFFVQRRVESTFTAMALLTLLIIVLSSIMILRVEIDTPNSNIRTAEDAIWWSVVTLATVGYGDFYPVTGEGRLIACLLMTVGIGIFATFAGLVATWLMAPEGQVQDAELDHIRHELIDIKKLLVQIAADRAAEQTSLPPAEHALSGRHGGKP